MEEDSPHSNLVEEHQRLHCAMGVHKEEHEVPLDRIRREGEVPRHNVMVVALVHNQWELLPPLP